MRRSAGFLAVAALLGCITSYDALPLCGSDASAAGSGTLMRSSRPTTVCRTSEEVQAYEDLLAFEVLRRSQWQFPNGIPLHVDLDANRRVARVCVGNPVSQASWSDRDRVASSLDSLRATPPGPACLAGTTLDLSSALVTGSVRDPFRFPIGMTDCPERRNLRCINQLRHVCAYYRDGSRRSFDNACEACREEFVVGYMDFVCE